MYVWMKFNLFELKKKKETPDKPGLNTTFYFVVKEQDCASNKESERNDLADC